MITSATISELAKAMAKAQAKIEGAHKDSKNPHFKSSYADLASCWDACRAPLSDNGLSVLQPLSMKDGVLICTTMLLHESGEFISEEFGIKPVQDTPQGAGSCATYLRRYSLCSMVGISPLDDDGNAASGINPGVTHGRTYPAPAKATTSAPAPSPAPAQAQSPVGGEPPPDLETFDETNPAHRLKAQQFLHSKKGNVRLLMAFLAAMKGKVMTQENAANALYKVDTETPDLPPEEM